MCTTGKEKLVGETATLARKKQMIGFVLNIALFFPLSFLGEILSYNTIDSVTAL
jgi:hypothetical protein